MPRSFLGVEVFLGSDIFSPLRMNRNPIIFPTTLGRDMVGHPVGRYEFYGFYMILYCFLLKDSYVIVTVVIFHYTPT